MNEVYVLELPLDLSKRKEILTKELEKIAIEEFKVEMNKLFEQYKDEISKSNLPKPSFIEFHVYFEGDDEGGEIPYISDITFFDEKENEIDYSIVTIQKKSWNDNVYDAEFTDVLNDALSDSDIRFELSKYLDEGENLKIDVR